jgi:hypothetical protein
MTSDQRDTIQAILVDRGLTFTPLQDEMIDHIGCDVELLMNSGRSFEEALQRTLEEIPAEHFSTVQRDVLVGIDERLAAFKGLSYLTIGSLLLAFLFKVLHLQFSDEIFIISFILIGATLLRGSFFGSSVTAKPKGITRLLFTLLGLIIFLTGYAFKILHLSGAETIIIVGSAVNVAALIINTYAFFRYPPGKETMLTFLHEKYTPSIERFLLILLFFITAVKIVSISTGFHVPVASVILLIIIFGAGLHFITMTWGILQQQVQFKRQIFLVGMVMTSVCLPLPFLGEILPSEIRVVSVTAFMVVSALLAFSMQQQTANVFSPILAGFVPLLFLTWAMLKLGVLPVGFERYLFNLPMLTSMVAGLLLSKKHDTMRSFMIISLAGFLIEYSL